MGKLICGIILLVLTYPVIGQEHIEDINNKKIAVNSVYLELFGNGMLYSVNYDRIISVNNRRMTTLRVGFSYYPKSKSTNISDNAISIPIEINFLNIQVFVHSH